MTQTDRLLAYLRTHPGASSFEITVALHIVNVTGRVSDLRERGVDVQGVRDESGVWRYRVVEKPEQLTWEVLTRDEDLRP